MGGSFLGCLKCTAMFKISAGVVLGIKVDFSLLSILRKDWKSDNLLDATFLGLHSTY